MAWLVLGLLPIGVFLALRRPWGRRLVGLIAAYLLFWFSTTQQIRFLAPILPVVCFLAAYGCVEAVRWVARRSVEKHALAAGAIGLALLAGPQLSRSWHRIVVAGPPPVTLAERAEYLARRFATYPFYQRLNVERGSRYVVYAFHDEPMKYYCRGTQLGDWYGQGRYGDIELATGSSLFRSLRRLGADFLLVDSRAFPTALPADESFGRHFILVFQRPGIAGFRLRAGEPAPALP